MSLQSELLTENFPHWTAITITQSAAEIQERELKPFVILSIKELQGIPEDRIANLKNAAKFSAIRAIVRHFARCRSATKIPWDYNDALQFIESLRFRPQCAAILAELLCKDELYANIPTHLRIKPGLVKFEWKIDVSMSHSNLSAENDESDTKKIMHQHTKVIIIFHLSNSETYIYRLSISKFHELRYVIASALKNMIVLEKRKCMRKD